MTLQFPPLPNVERLSDKIIRVLGGNPGKFTLQGTNTYLIGTGPKRILIDTGEGKPSWISALQSVLNDENATVKYVLLTHWHPDHVRGVPELLEICPDVRVYKNLPEDGQLDIRDGQVFEVEGVRLTAHHMPGHTKDHMVFVLEEEGAMFTGDNVLGHGTSVFEDLEVYLSSLERMQHCFSGRAYPGHGAMIEIGNNKIIEYIEHRKKREEEVLQVLKCGTLDKQVSEGSRRSWTPLELVKMIYHDVPRNLHVPASYGVVKVLKKLEAEGRLHMMLGVIDGRLYPHEACRAGGVIEGK